MVTEVFQVFENKTKQILSFLHRLGKTHLDQLQRQDIEAFVEREQDRWLKPNSVRTRL